MDNQVIHVINSPEQNAKTAPELKLFRPKIHYWLAVLYVVSHVIIGFTVTFLVALCINDGLKEALFCSLKFFWIATIALFLLTLRFSCIWFVRLYQRYAKSEVRLRCCMTPSCSEYSILAFKKYGAIVGGIKTIKRLKRCHPPGGIDYP